MHGGGYDYGLWATVVISVVYYRLALREERVAEDQFGLAYRAYRDQVPAFIPTTKSWANRRRGDSSPSATPERNGDVQASVDEAPELLEKV